MLWLVREVVRVSAFSGERASLFSAKEKENIDIWGNLKHFGSEKAPKCSIIAQKSLLGSF
jgi:hypothetical protein